MSEWLPGGHSAALKRKEVDNKEKIAYRGLSWNTKEEYEEFLKKTTVLLDTKPKSMGDSYSPSHENCENYMTKNWQVEVRYIRPAQLKNIRPFYSAMPGLKQNIAHPTSLESEFILLGGTRLKVINRYKSTTQTGKERTVIEVEDIRE